MVHLKTFDFPDAPEPKDCYRGLIVDALQEKGRLPAPHFQSDYPEHFSLENLAHVTVEAHAGGWVSYLHFQNTPTGAANCISTIGMGVSKTAFEAFMLGAHFVCVIATGSSELPVTAAGNSIMMVAYSPQAPA